MGRDEEKENEGPNSNFKLDKKTLCMYIEYIIVYACNIRKYTTI